MEIRSIFALAVAVPLVLQGFSLLPHPEPWKRLGILNLWLGALGLITFCMMRSGVMVLGRELGAVMAEGAWARAGLFVLLIGLSLAAGLAFLVVRNAVQPTIRAGSVLFFACAAGVAACFSVKTLNPSDPLPLRVHEYDLWWPPLACWIALCVLGIGMAIAGVKSKRAWLLFHLTVPSLFALVAVARSREHLVYAHPQTLGFWIAVLCVTLPSLLAIAAASLPVPDRVGSHPRAWRWLASSAAFLITLVSCLVWAYGGEWLFPVIIFWALAAAVMLGMLLFRGAARLRAWRDDGFNIPDLGRTGRWDDVTLVVAVLTIAASIGDLIGGGIFPPELLLAAAVGAWVIVVEICTQGRFHEVVLPSPLARASKGVASAVARVSVGAFSKLRELFRAENWPVAAIKAVAGLLAGIVFLVVLAELPNAGKTTLVPFSVTLTSDSKIDKAEDKLSRLIPDRVLNSLGRLRSELRTEVITLSGDKSNPLPTFGTASTAPSAWDAVLAKSSDLKIGGVEIPLGILATPIQAITRSVLGKREISGGFYVERDGFTLHAGSSTGDYWLRSAAAPSAMDAATVLADAIAFEMISKDPAMVSGGMTTHGAALDAFRKGVAEWRAYVSGDPDKLASAIRHFQDAIRHDANFALAYYRLGLAYRSDNQPSLALKQLQKSIAVRPDFVPGYNWLADTLYNFDDLRTPASAVTDRLSSPEKAQLARRKEARQLWRRVLLMPAALRSPHDVSSAYYGLCRSALDEDEVDLAYFLCTRAEQFYATLPDPVQEQSSTRMDRASVLNIIGVALFRKAAETRLAATTDWYCSPDVNRAELQSGTNTWVAQRNIVSSHYAGAALRYYDRALTLSPDDPIIRCNAADALAGMGDWTRMRELESDSARAHVVLAEQFAAQGHELAQKNISAAAKFYQLSLQEYAAAIEIEPSNLDALNGYAYTFWLWRVRAFDKRPPDGPSREIAHQAEEYARSVVRIARGNVPPADEAVYRSTLGEVLLGQGRAHEALKVLEDVRVSLPGGAAFDEIRWDYAQACLCANQNELAAGSDGNRTLLAAAATALRAVSDNEKGREDPRYSIARNWFDAGMYMSVCKWSPDIAVERGPTPGLPRYDVTVDHGSVLPCDRIGIAGTVDGTDGKAPEPFLLHIWGGGIEERIESQAFGDSGMRAIAFLTSEPANTQWIYFAQLENLNGDPMSAITPIATSDQCAQNQIQLNFKRAS